MLVVHVGTHARLVEEVKTNAFGGSTFIPFGPHVPVETECIQRFLIGPKVIRLVKTGIDAVARSPVQVQAHMDVVLVRSRNQPVDPFNGLLIDLVHLVRGDIAAPVKFYVSRVSHRNPHEIEAPVGHPAELLFACSLASLRRIGGEKVEQVKAFPFGQFVLRCLARKTGMLGVHAGVILR